MAFIASIACAYFSHQPEEIIYKGKKSHFIYEGVEYFNMSRLEEQRFNIYPKADINTPYKGQHKDCVGTPYMAYLIARTIFQYYFNDDYIYDYDVVNFRDEYWQVTGSRETNPYVLCKGGIPIIIIRKSNGQIVSLITTK